MRAMLEVLRKKLSHEDKLQQLSVGALGKGSYANFRTYASALRSRISQVDDDTWSRTVEEVESQFGGVEWEVRIGFTSLVRSLLGPCVESLILCDRFCFLREGLGAQDVDTPFDRVQLMNLFDFDLSPRNIVLLANKSSPGSPRTSGTC